MELGERGVLVLGFTPNHFNTGHVLASFSTEEGGTFVAKHFDRLVKSHLEVQVTRYGTKMCISPIPVISILLARGVTMEKLQREKWSRGFQ